MLAESPLVAEPEPGCSAHCALIARIATPHEATIFQLLENIAREQVHGLSRDSCPRNQRAPKYVAYFDRSMLRSYARQALTPVATLARPVDHGEKQRVFRGGDTGNENDPRRPDPSTPRTAGFRGAQDLSARVCSIALRAPPVPGAVADGSSRPCSWPAQEAKQVSCSSKQCAQCRRHAKSHEMYGRKRQPCYTGLNFDPSARNGIEAARRR